MTWSFEVAFGGKLVNHTVLLSAAIGALNLRHPFRITQFSDKAKAGRKVSTRLCGRIGLKVLTISKEEIINTDYLSNKYIRTQPVTILRN